MESKCMLSNELSVTFEWSCMRIVLGHESVTYEWSCMRIVSEHLESVTYEWSCMRIISEHLESVTYEWSCMRINTGTFGYLIAVIFGTISGLPETSTCE